MKDIEIKQLKYFAVLAEELHFGRAALKLSITQPALSQQIAKLEEELDAKLFIRDRRTVALTDAGKIFLEKVLGILASLDSAYEAAHSKTTSTNNTIRIGLVEYSRYPFMLPAIRELQKLYPEVQLQNNNLYADQIVLALMQNEIDIGIALPSKMTEGQDQINSVPILTGHWLVIVPNTHSLAQHKSLTLKDIALERLLFITPATNPPLYNEVSGAFLKQGIKPNFVLGSGQPEVNRTMALQGFGLALGSSLVYQPVENEQSVLIPLTGLSTELVAHLYWRKNESSGLVLDFTEILTEEAAKIK